MTNKLRYSVVEAADMLSLAPVTVWRKIASGEIRSVKDGRRRLIMAAELDRYANGGTR